MIARMKHYPSEGTVPARPEIRAQAAKIQRHWHPSERVRRRRQAEIMQRQLFAPLAPYVIAAGFTS